MARHPQSCTVLGRGRREIGEWGKLEAAPYLTKAQAERDQDQYLFSKVHFSVNNWDSQDCSHATSHFKSSSLNDINY